MRCPFATWQPSPNDYAGGLDLQPMGVVLHIEQGSEAGTASWFHNPGTQASSHFGVAKSGAIDQFVDTHDAAWAEVDGNRHWFSIEHEGFQGESLTPPQIESDAKIISWLRGAGFVFPMQITDNTSVPGIGWHGMGGAGWGGHFDCPGEPIKSQRGVIIARAVELLTHTGIPAPAPYAPAWPGVYFTTPPDTIDGYVRRWQQRMADRGWSIAVDGDYGPKSKSICEQFQKEKGLMVDGVVGPQTWLATWTATVT